jgi:transcriptional regulator with XRE-family HTH domain
MKPSRFEVRIIVTLKAIRVIKNLKQMKLADALHIQQSSNSKIENCQKALTFEQLRLLSAYLGVSYHEILFIAENESVHITNNSSEIHLILNNLSESRKSNSNLEYNLTRIF